MTRWLWLFVVSVAIVVAVGCSLLEGARAGASSALTGQPSHGAPAGSSPLDSLLYNLGSALAGAGAFWAAGKLKDGSGQKARAGPGG